MSEEELKDLKWQQTEYEENIITELVKENEKLNNKIEKLEQENAVLKTQVSNKDKYTYGIRMDGNKEC